ncbi:MAG: FlgB family protein [Pseudomonadota bacterium]
MSSELQILSLAEALAEHASRRQVLVARNVAHADTPGHRARDLAPFSETVAAQAAQDGEGFRPRAMRPGHAGFADASGAGAEVVEDARTGAASPNGNTVSLEDQMVRAAEARMQHDLALGVWRKSLDILRAAMGPAR